jgi:type IV pilus assembly protein PilQ
MNKARKWKPIILFLGGLLYFFISGLGENGMVLGAPLKKTSPTAKLIQIEDQILPDRLQVLIQTSLPVSPKHFILANPHRLVLELNPLVLGKDHPIQIKDPLIEGLKFIQKNKKTVRLTFSFSQAPQVKIFPKKGNPTDLVIEFLKSQPPRPLPLPQKEEEIVLRPKTLAEFSKEKVRQEKEARKQIDDIKKDRVQFDFYMENLHNVLRMISDLSNVNIVVGDDVKEKKVTLTLKEVTWKEALEAILESTNLEKIEQSPNTYLVITRENYLKKLDEDRKNKEAKRKEEQEELRNEGERQRVGKVLYQSRQFLIKNVDVKVVEELIQGSLERQRKIITQPGSQPGLQPGAQPVVQTDTSRFIGTTIDIISVPHTNTLIARGTERDLNYIENLVQSIDHPLSQVMIEARIVEANANFTRDLGIRWGGILPFSNSSGPFAGILRGGVSGSAADPGSNLAVNLPFATANAAFGGLGFTFSSLNFNLDARIQAMEKAGNGKTLSSPKILTLDNKKAIIKQGASIPVSTRNELGTFSTVYRDAALTLEVIPHILSSGKKLRIELKITKNEPDFTNKDTLGNPAINTKEAFTEMVINDGNTVVLGGIIFKKESYNEYRLPGLGDIPVLGYLFKTRTKSFEDTELLIFLTPRIMRSTLKERFGGDN